MFRLWGKLVKDSRIIESETIERPEEDTRTHKVFASVAELCRIWDLGTPIWLDAAVSDFKRHKKARFYADSFMEEIDFDYLEIQIIEED